MLIGICADQSCWPAWAHKAHAQIGPSVLSVLGATLLYFWVFAHSSWAFMICIMFRSIWM